MKVIELSDREAEKFQAWLVSQETWYSNYSKDNSPLKEINIDIVISIMAQLEDQDVETPE